jgi:hypothetical protein
MPICFRQELSVVAMQPQHLYQGSCGAGGAWDDLLMHCSTFIDHLFLFLQISNGITIWLGISPPDLFFYAVSMPCCGQSLLLCVADSFALRQRLPTSTSCSAAHLQLYALLCFPPLAAVVPAAVVGGQCDSHRLLHVLKGGDCSCLFYFIGSNLYQHVSFGPELLMESSRLSFVILLFAALGSHLAARLCHGHHVGSHPHAS